MAMVVVVGKQQILLAARSRGVRCGSVFDVYVRVIVGEIQLCREIPEILGIIKGISDKFN